jgi:tol-pal system protein YbgF
MLAIMVAGCATQADIQELEREQRRLRTQMADTRAGVDSMQRDVAKVRGGVDEVRYSSRGSQSVTARLDALEARIAALEGRPSPGATPADTIVLDGSAPTNVPVATPTPLPPRPEIAATDLEKEEARDIPDEYRRGLTLVRQGAYDKAIQALRDFLRTNRESPLAPNAQYWIGESYYMLADYYQAILNFNQVRQQHPKSDRAPAAVLKIGLAFQQMGNKSEARLAFQKVLNDYPSSPEAAQAREKLQAL